jgi:hypothetical protein
MRAPCHGFRVNQDIDITGNFVLGGAVAGVGSTAKLPPPADFAGPFTLY